jgi:hypothetical protein
MKFKSQGKSTSGFGTISTSDPTTTLEPSERTPDEFSIGSGDPVKEVPSLECAESN